MIELSNAIVQQKDHLVQTVQECIRIPSVQQKDSSGAPYGAEIRRCLQFVLDTAKNMGFTTINMDDQMGWCELGEGKEMVLVLGHLDVVPAGDGWDGNPFSGDIRDGKIFGRGAIDDKGPAIAALYALKAIKDSNIVLKRRIRLLFGCNEETGSADIKYYLHHGGEVPTCGFTPDGEYPVINGEKGIINVKVRHDWKNSDAIRITLLTGGKAPNVVPSSALAEIACPQEMQETLMKDLPEKVSATAIQNGIRFEAQGIGAHGSTPEQGENAIGRLLIALADRLPTGEQKKTLAFLADKIGMDTDGEKLGIALHDEISGALTFNLGTIQGDEKGIELFINYRYPVTRSYDDCAPILMQRFREQGFYRVDELHKKKLYVPEDNELVQTLLHVYAQLTGLPAKAKCIGGGTYAKSLPNTVAFGPIFPGDEIREHKANEYIEIDKLVQNAAIFAAAMYELAQEKKENEQ